ncbi:hypothetical protein CK203_115590 [Vitis vinifera]|uniref:Integrase catalytic domain-containing protein n=1 Tax=Vitis vinifera TaxID=29760 RepID=A0A438F0Q7_VITVI|nr:hypothetical protein CK203_115590 [Vitis vinifera]
MREVHVGVYGSHMGGHMLARKIMRTSYFRLTMKTDCCQFVQTCPELWGIDIIGKIFPKSSSGHEFILVAIDYFTKWVKAASYARLTSIGVASFIRSHIICRYGVPHELISDRGVHFKAEVDTLVQKYGIQHHRSYTLLLSVMAQARLDQLNLLDERGLRAADHVHAYQRKMARAFKKRVKPRPLQIGDLVLKVIKGLIRDPKGKFKPNWSGP